ncbi:PIN domain-containing protein [Thalassospira mesophila]|uniref:Uncharacterized protein n=1 Tax=Thalassospira mesophila TaxID=1293891 RepID=A0A1Y2L2L5_9PROT|nr:PIN domain-containing protein [Thalassospira mesophila]OSQ38430.1 hypothetical protein TMES_11400 [Thalassospira mesophila]
MTYRADHFTALIDACVLAGALKRNLLLSLAGAELFRPRWSGEILGEMEVAIAKITNGKADTAKQRSAMERAFPEACVSGYEIYIRSIELPDENDRHVLAAAVRTYAQVLVTDNLRDFPKDKTGPFGIEVKSPDEFIADTITLHMPTAFEAIRKMRERLNHPELTASEIILKVEAHGLPQTASLLTENRSFWG